MSSLPVLELKERFEVGLMGRVPVVAAASFVLPEPGTYTLEGPNGSGKSLFIRMLTGTLPGAVNRPMALPVWIDGRRNSIETYRDATRAGIIAVFQDDDLISSMTVFEYLVLVHSTTSPSDLRQYAWDIVFSSLVHPVSAALRHLGPTLSDGIHRLLERIEPGRIDWKDRRALRAAAEGLLKEHGVNSRILDQIPGRLSGGGRASARIISAQLHKRTRVLLLDEAFNSVERNVWPQFLETIKKWALERSAAVLAISHSSYEIDAWEPRIRFEINDGILRPAASSWSMMERRFARQRQGSSSIFRIVNNGRDERLTVFSSLWERFGRFERVVWFVEDGAPLGELDSFLPLGISSEMVRINPSDLASFGNALEILLARMSFASGAQRSVIVVAGGGPLRAVASLCALITDVNMAGMVIVLASFREAVESILFGGVSSPWKSTYSHQAGITTTACYHPAAYLVLLGGLGTEKAEVLRADVIRCLRLGLLFDADLFRETCAALVLPRISVPMALDLLDKSISVVNQLADIDYGDNLQNLLEMGDLHSALLRDDSDVSPEASVRLLGLALELMVTRSDDLANELLRVFRDGAYPIPGAVFEEARWVDLKQLNAGMVPTRAIKVDRVGKFNVALMRADLASAMSRKNTSISHVAEAEMKGAVVEVGLREIREAVLRLQAALEEV